MFKVTRYLGDIGVPFWTEGKNVSDGWTSIQCPFCGDRSNHGAFSPNGLGFSCFKCGNKKSYLHLIAHFSEVSFEEAKGIARQYTTRLSYIEQDEHTRSNAVEWPPPYSENELPNLHAQYLSGRGYDVRRIRELFGIKAMYQTGPFKYRILIPVIMNGRVVTYIGRDVTDKQSLRYKNLKEELSILPAKECIYNIDNVGRRGLIVEGPTDVWRFRFNAVSPLGLVFTRKQVKLLSERLDEAFICFDNEPQAQEKAEELAQELSLSGTKTEIILIDQSDPGEMSQGEADEIIQEVFGDKHERE